MIITYTIYYFNYILLIIIIIIIIIYITIVTLLGAHTLGHTHIETSGYGLVNNNNNNAIQINAWDSTPDIFDNRYYDRTINIVINNCD